MVINLTLRAISQIFQKGKIIINPKKIDKRGINLRMLLPLFQELGKRQTISVSNVVALGVNSIGRTVRGPRK